MKESENLFNFVTRGVCSSDRYARYKLAEEKIDGVNVLLIGGEGETVELVEGINYIIPEGKVSYEIRAIDREIVEHLINFVETKTTESPTRQVALKIPQSS